MLLQQFLATIPAVNLVLASFTGSMKNPMDGGSVTWTEVSHKLVIVRSPGGLLRTSNGGLCFRRARGRIRARARVKR